MYGESLAYTVGINDHEGPPVPIPNTEVKLMSVESTWLATTWEDRSMPTFFAKGHKMCKKCISYDYINRAKARDKYCSKCRGKTKSVRALGSLV